MKHILAFLLAASCSAFAAEGNGSEYQWQTPADKWEVTPSLWYRSMTLAPKGGGSDTKITGMNIGVRGEYGISEMFSAGLMLGNVNYKSEQGTTSTKESGMVDPVAFFHGRSAMGNGSLRYGADVGFSLGKSEKEASGDTNAASGGMSITPFVGYEMSADACTYGARLSYKMYLGDRTETNNQNTPATEDKLSGDQETTLALFYEHDMAPLKIGAALEFMAEAKGETKSGGTTTKDAGYTTTALHVYVPYMVNDMVTILPDLRYTKFTAFDTSSIDSGSGFEVGVGGRFQF